MNIRAIFVKASERTEGVPAKLRVIVIAPISFIATTLSLGTEFAVLVTAPRVVIGAFDAIDYLIAVYSMGTLVIGVTLANVLGMVVALGCRPYSFHGIVG